MPNEKKYLAQLQEAVNSPSHYTQGSMETIDMIKESLTEEEFSGYLKGNILKYVCRYKHKGMPLKDLMKSQWYLERLMREQKTNEE
jgi:hypothetical protein|tara:strand:- start:276 stop:533 length:258 start_codon:yes stop_codon:yes gene_type:complete